MRSNACVLWFAALLFTSVRAAAAPPAVTYTVYDLAQGAIALESGELGGEAAQANGPVKGVITAESGADDVNCVFALEAGKITPWGKPTGKSAGKPVDKSADRSCLKEFWRAQNPPTVEVNLAGQGKTPRKVVLKHREPEAVKSGAVAYHRGAKAVIYRGGASEVRVVAFQRAIGWRFGTLGPLVDDKSEPIKGDDGKPVVDKQGQAIAGLTFRAVDTGLATENGELKNGATVYLIEGDGKKYLRYTVDKDAVETLDQPERVAVAGGAPVGIPPPAANGVDTSKDLDCPAPSDVDASYVICINLAASSDPAGAHQRYQAQGPQDGIIRPNRSTVVIVKHQVGDVVDVEMVGESGLTRPTIRTDQSETARNAAQSAPPNAPPTFMKTVARFGPRKPGPADVKVSMRKGEQTSVVATYPLVVEEMYYGAVRLGVGAVFGDAVGRSYEARRVGGSQQAEVAATTSGPVDFELVLGIAPFLFNGREGRPAVTSGTKFAPYAGIGLVNQTSTGVELLTSLYLGLEWEFVPSFSVASGLVLRRVERLSPGLSVGSPFDGEDVPTEKKILPGVGVVINFSPEFLKLAKQPGSSFFK